MSAYENVVGGKLKLKGKPLDVKAANIKKKKKNKHKYTTATTTTTTLSLLSDSSSSQLSASGDHLLSQGGSMETVTDPNQEDTNGANKSGGEGNASYIDNLTPAERRYMEQRQQIDIHKLAKTANKSHRDRISDFNQYLANMSEHYDIPKVGPG